MRIDFNTRSLADYETFLAVRNCPVYEFRGHSVFVPDEYAASLGLGATIKPDLEYKPIDGMFDYQRDITRIAIAKRKYAMFADCGLGKTLMLLEFARHCHEQTGRKVLIVSPLMVVHQTIAEARTWYGDSMPVQQVAASGLNDWLEDGIPGIACTNYEAIREGLPEGNLAGLILDESSMLKSHYGAYGERLIKLGRTVEWKLCCTGTPAPNDRIEFANHAVFLNRARTVNVSGVVFYQPWPDTKPMGVEATCVKAVLSVTGGLVDIPDESRNLRMERQCWSDSADSYSYRPHRSNAGTTASRSGADW
jgi:hypothetical protein